MCRSTWLLLLVGWLVAGQPLSGQTPRNPETPSDEQVLQSAKVATDGPGLLAYFRNRTLTDEGKKRVAELIRQLGSRSFSQREKATAELKAIGVGARAQLIAALNDKDMEVQKRARECLEILESATTPQVEAAAVRLLRTRKPEGACAVLLDYAPSVKNASIEEEILLTLLDLGQVEGKVDKVFDEALEAPIAAQRALAALVLGYLGTPAEREKVRELLKTEADSRVRLRAAQGLLAAKDRTPVPVLLNLLTTSPRDIAQDALDTLNWAAGPIAPTVELGDNPMTRLKCREEWEAWWKANESKVTLAAAKGEMPWNNSAQRACQVTMRFIRALMERKIDQLRETTEVPFSIMGFMTLKTRQDFDGIFGEALKETARQPKITFSAPRLVKLQDFLKDQPAGIKEFLNTVPKAEIRVVYLTGKEEGGKEDTAVILVRVRGDQARVIGLAEIKSPGKDGK